VLVILGYIVVQNLIIGIVTDAFEKAKTAADGGNEWNVSFFMTLKLHFYFYRWYCGTWCYRFLHFLFGLCPCIDGASLRVKGGMQSSSTLMNIDKDGCQYVRMRAFPDLSWKKLRTQFFSRDKVWTDEDDKPSVLNLQLVSLTCAFFSTIMFVSFIVIGFIGSQELSLEGITRGQGRVALVWTGASFLAFTLLSWLFALIQTPGKGVSLPKNRGAERYLLARSDELAVLTTHLMMPWDQWGEPIPDLEFLMNEHLSAEDLFGMFEEFSHDHGKEVKERESIATEFQKMKASPKTRATRTPAEFFKELKKAIREIDALEPKVFEIDSKTETELFRRVSLSRNHLSGRSNADVLLQRPLMNDGDCEPDARKELNLILILSELLGWNEEKDEKEFKLSEWMDCNPKDETNGFPKESFEGSDFANHKKETVYVENIRRRKVVFDRMNKMALGIADCVNPGRSSRGCCGWRRGCKPGYERTLKDIKEVMDDDNMPKVVLGGPQDDVYIKEILLTEKNHTHDPAIVASLNDVFTTRKTHKINDERSANIVDTMPVQILSFEANVMTGHCELGPVNEGERVKNEQGRVTLTVHDLIFLPGFGLFGNRAQKYPHAPLIDALVRTYGSFDEDLERGNLMVTKEVGHDSHAPWIKPVIEKALKAHEKFKQVQADMPHLTKAI
jgi:hypothetical protein